MSTRFTALTIEQGDAFLLEDNGRNYLFDSGFDKKIIDLLKYKGIDKLDLAICSHNDADHANGFIKLLQPDSGIKIDEIWLPGLWASILQFVRDNCNEPKEIHCSEEDFMGELGPLYSGEFVSLELFNKTLSFFVEWKDSNNMYQFHDDLLPKQDGKDSCVVQFLDNYLVHNLIHTLTEDFNYDNLEDFLNDSLEELYENHRWIINRKEIRRICGIINLGRVLNKPLPVSELKKISHIACYHYEDDNYASFLDIKLERIMEIASLAYQRGCKIRFFEPTTNGNNKSFPIDYGFVAFNSKEISRVKKLENSLMYLYALNLTKENKYSMVFEYVKNGIPLIRFSADSKSICQSVSPYPENIIVTAPHHGSKANANVYASIQGDDIIWVRSDSKYTGNRKRPCDTFKSMKNKYCLACDRYNFISEVCFEYNPTLKLWSYVHGERCRCKP